MPRRKKPNARQPLDCDGPTPEESAARGITLQLRLPPGLSSPQAREDAFVSFSGSVMKLCIGLEGERPWSDELRVTDRCYLHQQRNLLIAQVCVVAAEDIALLSSKISEGRLQLPAPLGCAVSAVWDGAVGETAVRVIDLPAWATPGRVRARLERAGFRVLSAVPERDERGFARASAALLRLNIAADGPRPPSELRFRDQLGPSRCDIVTDVPVMPLPASSGPAARPPQPPAHTDSVAAAAASPAAAAAGVGAAGAAGAPAVARPASSQPATGAVAPASQSASPHPRQPRLQVALPLQVVPLPLPPPQPSSPPSERAAAPAQSQQQQRTQQQAGPPMQLRRRRTSQSPQDQQLLAADASGSLQLARQPAAKRSKSPPEPPPPKLRLGDARGSGNRFAPLALLLP